MLMHIFSRCDPCPIPGKLIQWIDVIAVSLDLQYSILDDEDNHHIPGTFHHVTSINATKFRRVFQSRTAQHGSKRQLLIDHPVGCS